MKPTIHQVLKFNEMKLYLLEWKHYADCEDDSAEEVYRDMTKAKYEQMLKEFPKINEILPEFYCYCKTKKT